jgi:hypothetical protein
MNMRSWRWVCIVLGPPGRIIKTNDTLKDNVSQVSYPLEIGTRICLSSLLSLQMLRLLLWLVGF